jgi:hypothetical protein
LTERGHFFRLRVPAPACRVVRAFCEDLDFLDRLVRRLGGVR